MICGTFTIDSVPNGQEDVVLNGFKSNDPPPTTAGKTKNADGTWKITGTWPPCPAGTSSSHSTA